MILYLRDISLGSVIDFGRGKYDPDPCASANDSIFAPAKTKPLGNYEFPTFTVHSIQISSYTILPLR